MKLLIDTSVIVAASVREHPDRSRAVPVLQRIRDGLDEGIVSVHSLAEVYSTLTSMPIRPHIKAVTAKQVIQHNILDICEVMALDVDDYIAVINHLVQSALVGRVTYDALIVYAALKASVDAIATFSRRDFQRIYREQSIPLLDL